MLTIHKYVIGMPPWRPDSNPEVQMPKGARVLSFQAVRQQPTIWAIVDTEASMERREFYLRTTGQPLHFDPTRAEFIGTAQFKGGTQVFHLFEKSNGF